MLIGSGTPVKLGYATGVRTELLESYFRSHMHLGLLAGRYWMSDVGNEDLSGSGAIVGLSLNLVSPQWKRLRLAHRTSYQYDLGRGDAEEFSLRLHTLETEVLTQIALSQNIRLQTAVGAYAQQGGGTGQVTAQASWNGPINSFYKVGVDILVEQSGHIGIESKIKLYPSLEVYFQRRY